MMLQRKIAIIGAGGMLASMIRARAPESLKLLLFDLPEFDITSRDQVNDTLGAVNPDVIINCAAFTQVDACETQQDTAFAVNGDGPSSLAEAAKAVGAILVHISTDFIFSGDALEPYSEDAPTEPVSIYGQSKLQGEMGIVDSDLTDYYIVRTSWLYGPKGSNFVETIIRLATEHEELSIVADQTGTPTYTADLADAIWMLLTVVDEPAPFGIYHYSNYGACTWYDFACEIVQQLQKLQIPLMVQKVKPIATFEYPVPAARPNYSVLSKEKIVTAVNLHIPSWQESLRTYLELRK